jgi:hypothetical protein
VHLENGGSAWFGSNGIQSTGAVNTVNGIGRRAIFSTGSAGASAIQLMGGTVITADPPVSDDLYQAEEIHFSNFGGTLEFESLPNAGDAITLTDPADAWVHPTVMPSFTFTVPGSGTSDVQSDPSISSSESGNEFVPIAFITPATHSNMVDDQHIGLGETLLTPSKQTTVNFGCGSLTLKAGSIVSVERQATFLKVRVLFENAKDAVQVTLPGRCLNVRVGEETIISQNKQNLALAMNDSIGRRRTDVTHSGQLVVSTSEISLLSVMQSGKLLPSLLHSNSKEDRALAGKLTKMAACIMQTTAGHGSYTNAR